MLRSSLLPDTIVLPPPPCSTLCSSTYPMSLPLVSSLSLRDLPCSMFKPATFGLLLTVESQSSCCSRPQALLLRFCCRLLSLPKLHRHLLSLPKLRCRLLSLPKLRRCFLSLPKLRRSLLSLPKLRRRLLSLLKSLTLPSIMSTLLSAASRCH